MLLDKKLFRSDYDGLWKGMPEFTQKDLSPEYQTVVSFRSLADLNDFSRIIGQKFPIYKKHACTIWHPAADIGITRGKRYVSEKQVNPKYPVYVISKGRWESRLTSRYLEKMRVPYKIVVEPQEYKRYAAVIDPKKILKLPFSNLGKGSIPARNWVWENAIESGAERHWILDDNIRCFFRLNNNLKIRVLTGAIFRAAEDFTDRFSNVAESGFNYFMFASRKAALRPFVFNTRIYSCILLKNNLPFRWRGRYNEDTDLSLRILKSGLCTILFNSFLAEKTTTMTMSGGNTDELYAGDGRLKMAESLKRQHPEHVLITRKWNRVQHHVNFKAFRVNKPKLQPGIVVSEEPNEFGMVLKDASRS